MRHFSRTELKAAINMLKEFTRMQSEESLRLSQKRLAQAEKRIGELDRLFIRIYEDNVAGRLDDERLSLIHIFINKLADRVLVLDKNGITEYLGNYDYYVCLLYTSRCV